MAERSFGLTARRARCVSEPNTNAMYVKGQYRVGGSGQSSGNSPFLIRPAAPSRTSNPLMRAQARVSA